MIDASDAVMADCRKGVDDVMTYVFGMCVVCLWDVREVFVVCLWDVREVVLCCRHKWPVESCKFSALLQLQCCRNCKFKNSD